MVFATGDFAGIWNITRQCLQRELLATARSVAEAPLAGTSTQDDFNPEDQPS